MDVDLDPLAEVVLSGFSSVSTGSQKGGCGAPPLPRGVPRFPKGRQLQEAGLFSLTRPAHNHSLMSARTRGRTGILHAGVQTDTVSPMLRL